MFPGRSDLACESQLARLGEVLQGLVGDKVREGALEEEKLLAELVLLILLLQNLGEAAERQRPAIAAEQGRVVEGVLRGLASKPL